MCYHNDVAVVKVSFFEVILVRSVVSKYASNLKTTGRCGKWSEIWISETPITQIWGTFDLAIWESFGCTCLTDL